MKKFKGTIELQKYIWELAQKTGADYESLLKMGFEKHIEEIISEINEDSNWKDILEVIAEAGRDLLSRALDEVLKFLRDPVKLIGIFKTIGKTLVFAESDEEIQELKKRVIIQGDIKNSGIALEDFLKISQELNREDQKLLMLYGLPEFNLEENIGIISYRINRMIVCKEQPYSDDVLAILNLRIANGCKEFLETQRSHAELYDLYWNLHCAEVDTEKNLVLQKVLDSKLDFVTLAKWGNNFLTRKEVPIPMIIAFFDQLLEQSSRLASRMEIIKGIMRGVEARDMREEFPGLFKNIQEKINQQALQLV